MITRNIPESRKPMYRLLCVVSSYYTRYRIIEVPIDLCFDNHHDHHAPRMSLPPPSVLRKIRNSTGQHDFFFLFFLPFSRTSTVWNARLKDRVIAESHEKIQLIDKPPSPPHTKTPAPPPPTSSFFVPFMTHTGVQPILWAKLDQIVTNRFRPIDQTLF